jgi:hypothetical protein
VQQLELPFNEGLTEYEKLWFEGPNGNELAKASPVKGDLKAGVGGKKPQLSQVPIGAMTWIARAMQYGCSKYERGNYLRPQVDKVADLDRLSAYIDAGLRHIYAVTTEIEWMRGNTDLSGPHTLIGAYPDVESKLPHLAHALCSLVMAVQQGINAGILPEDPGTPWEVR